MKVTDEDHARIAAAVARAESLTSGEIRCVLAQETGNTPLAAVVAGASAALVAPPLAILIGVRPGLITGLFAGWTAAHATAGRSDIDLVLTVYIALQALVFALVGGLFLVAPLRRALSGQRGRLRVRKAAVEQFHALGLARTRDRTGVLILASLDDRRAEVLADSGIYEKTRPEDWQGVADALVAGLARRKPADGFVAAVEVAGEILAHHFPRKDDDTDELPNDLVTRKR